MPEYVRCNRCGAIYTDKPSIDMVKKWLQKDDHYAPCPVISCPGEMEVKGESDSQNTSLGGEFVRK